MDQSLRALKNIIIDVFALFYGKGEGIMALWHYGIIAWGSGRSGMGAGGDGAVSKKPGFCQNFGILSQILLRNPVSQSPRTQETGFLPEFWHPSARYC